MVDQAAELRNLVSQASRDTHTPCGPRPRLVVFSGGKGGVGVTTLAINVAISLVDQGLRVVLVDADLYRADVATLCQLPERGHVGDILSARRDIHEVLERGPGGILVVPGVWAPDHEIPFSHHCAASARATDPVARTPCRCRADRRGQRVGRGCASVLVRCRRGRAGHDSRFGFGHGLLRDGQGGVGRRRRAGRLALDRQQGPGSGSGRRMCIAASTSRPGGFCSVRSVRWAAWRSIRRSSAPTSLAIAVDAERPRLSRGPCDRGDCHRAGRDTNQHHTHGRLTAAGNRDHSQNTEKNREARFSIDPDASPRPILK